MGKLSDARRSAHLLPKSRSAEEILGLGFQIPEISTINSAGVLLHDNNEMTLNTEIIVYIHIRDSKPKPQKP